MVFAVDSVPSVNEAGEVLAANAYDVALLDADDLAVECLKGLRDLSTENSQTQFIVCASTDALPAAMAAIEHGAQDFIVKPLRPAELRLRIMQAGLRGSSRTTGSDGATTRFGPLSVDLRSGEITIDGARLELTPRERGVLQHLMNSRRNVVTKDQIAARVFNLESDANPKAIETYIHRLRKKLNSSDVVIETVRGLGYRLTLKASDETAMSCP